MLEPGPDLYPQKNLVNAALARNCHFEPFEKLRVNSARNLSLKPFCTAFDPEQIPML
jgi:hypothetical protein